MKTIVALGGDGIGPEVVDAACEVLAGAGLPVDILTPPHADAAVKSHGAPMPDETERRLREADGVLFGAAGGRPLERGRPGSGGSRPPTPACARSSTIPAPRSPLAHPEGIDMVIVRENSEGLYPGREGELADLTRALPDLADRTGKRVNEYGEGRFAVKVVTRPGVERIARFACRSPTGAEAAAARAR